MFRPRHPFPVQEFKRFPRYMEPLFAIAAVIVMALGKLAVWSIVSGILVTWFGAWIFYTRLRCPLCRGRMEGRNEMDDREVDHLFYDCHRCEVTFDPDYRTSNGWDESSSGDA